MANDFEAVADHRVEGFAGVHQLDGELHRFALKAAPVRAGAEPEDKEKGFSCEGIDRNCRFARRAKDVEVVQEIRLIGLAVTFRNRAV
jgi:hypothetical protein